MIGEDDKVLVKAAKFNHWFYTDILDDYIGGWIIRLQTMTEGMTIGAVFKVQKDTNVCILKTVSCSLKDSEAIQQAKREYELLRRSSELTSGVAKPLNFKELENKDVKTYYLETIYEYCGDNLYIVSQKATGQEIVSIMRAVAETMTILEANGIFHSDLKPDNIAVKEGAVKILDFGLATGSDTRMKEDMK